MMIASNAQTRGVGFQMSVPGGGWPRTVRGTPTLLADFQRLLRSMGVQLGWSAEIQTSVR
jgi:hypothetical protein